MINAYKDGKDLYAMIASRVYHNNYEDNLEFNPITGVRQPDGAQRRTSVKSLLLGIMYGMGTASIANSLGVSKKEAESIRNSFFNEFPKVESWITETQKFAHETGYVRDIWGRRRRLPDILLPKYEIVSKNKVNEFNPLLHTTGLHTDYSMSNELLSELDRCKWKSDVDAVKQKASANGYTIMDNTGYIATAERQCVNARIQGGAASMSKIAMIRVANNQELKDLGFRLLIAVHDELIGECPIENKERCKEVLSEEMIKSALPEVTVPMKCDADDFPSWYFDVYSSKIREEYEESGCNFDNLCYTHSELLPEQLKDIIGEGR